YAAEIFYVVQRQPRGLCDAIFRAEPFAAPHDRVLIGLPDTIWFPENAFLPALELDDAGINLMLFPVNDPSAFDAVVVDDLGYVRQVEVKRADASTQWIWGAVTCTGVALHALRCLWEARHRIDQYL